MIFNEPEFITGVTSLLLIIFQRVYLHWKVSRFKLTDHAIFEEMSKAIYDINKWKIKKNREVFSQALLIKLRCWRQETFKLANQLQKKSYTKKQLDTIITRWIYETVNLYTEKWKEEGIPEIVIDIINETNDGKIRNFENRVEEIIYGRMYPFKMLKIIAIFDHLLTLLAYTINDFNRLVYRDKYNGRFKGVTYKGVPINDEEYEIWLANNYGN